jgi:phosphate transport system substrate-binding protein
MKSTRKSLRTLKTGLFLGLSLCLALSGCRPREQGGIRTLRVKGSDTMVNLAQAWAEAYHAVNPRVRVEVSGGGSGTGIAALIAGTVDIADASREMKSREREAARRNTGKTPRELTVGYDALAVYVHKDNPLDQITREQLARIYAEGGDLVRWSQLGVTVPGCKEDRIVRISRQSNSGTYVYFREHVLNKKDYKAGSRDMNGSKEVVELVSHTPCAIGYSGMGYATPEVKMLKVARRAGGPAYAPTVENAVSKKYPIARALYVYTLGEPTGAVKEYLEWILSSAGQKIVAETGYVPLNGGK